MSVTGVAASTKWRVRYTWRVVKGLSHPEFTYEDKADEDRAIDAAVCGLDRNDDRASVYVVEAHIQAPGSDAWRRIDYQP